MRGSIYFVAGTLLLAACAHRSDDTIPAPEEPASIKVPEYAITPKVALVEVIMFRELPQPQVMASVEVGTLIPSAPTVSSCVERAHEGACVTYACEGFLADDDYDKRYHAGPVHIRAAGHTLDLKPSPSDEYPRDTAHLGTTPITDPSVVVTADGADIPPFRLAATFPPKVRILLPGRETYEPNDFSNPWYAGSTARTEDLVVPIEPPDVPVDVFIEGWQLNAPLSCNIGDRCTVMAHCQLPKQAPIPQRILANFAVDAMLEITVLSAQRSREKVGDFDVELLAYGSANRVRYLLH